MKIYKFLSLLLLISLQPLSAQQQEKYFFSKTLNGTFEEVTSEVKSVLKEQGFGVITEIDMDVKLKEKLDGIEMNRYKILGVCNPSFANQAIQAEENIGLFLPCKVLVKDLGNSNIEVVMVNTLVLMSMLGNKELDDIAAKVNDKLNGALQKL